MASEPHDLSMQHVPRDVGTRLNELAAAAQTSGYTFDTYGEGVSLRRFEQAVAKFLGHEAAAFFSTGTAAQHAALFALTIPKGEPLVSRRRPIVMVHPTSHLIFHDCLRDGPTQIASFEAESLSSLPEFEIESYGVMQREPTFADIEEAFARRVPDVLVIELPQRMNGGRTMAYEALVQVSELCKTRGVKMHCDGARLWEVQPFYGPRSKEVAQVSLMSHISGGGSGAKRRRTATAAADTVKDTPPTATFTDLARLFDTCYVSFYKGIGALAGSMLVGSSALVADAVLWGKRRGADVFTRGPIALDCEVQLRACYPEMGEVGSVQDPNDEASWRVMRLIFEQRLLRMRRMVKVVQDLTAASGVVRFDPPVPQSTMVHCYLKGTPERLEACHTSAREQSGVRLWNRLRGRGHAALPRADGSTGALEPLEGEWHYFEWSAGAGNTSLDDEVVQRGWEAFLGEISRAVRDGD